MHPHRDHWTVRDLDDAIEKLRNYVSPLRRRPSVRDVCELDLPQSTERPSEAA